MKDVIQKLLATEEEAKDIVAAARHESERILAEARARAKELIQRSEGDARSEAEQIAQSIDNEAVLEEQRELALADAEISQHVRLEPTVLQNAVNAVVQCVCGQH